MDPIDAQWGDNEGMKNFRAFIAKYMPGVDISDINYLFGYAQGMLLERLLAQCGSDQSRENIIRQAKNFRDLVLPTALPGIKINTSDKINMNYTQMRLQRWTGTHWDQFSEVLDAASEECRDDAETERRYLRPRAFATSVWRRARRKVLAWPGAPPGQDASQLPSPTMARRIRSTP